MTPKFNYEEGGFVTVRFPLRKSVAAQPPHPCMNKQGDVCITASWVGLNYPSVPESCVVGYEPPPPQVGDLVEHMGVGMGMGSRPTATIKAIIDNKAWICWTISSGNTVVDLSALRRTKG